MERSWRLGRMKITSLADVLTLEELEIVVPAMEILADAVRRKGFATPDGDKGHEGGDDRLTAPAVVTKS